MKNPYALLNYDMENDKPTPEFKKATEFITKTITKMVKGIKSEKFTIEPKQIGYCFYGNLHWGLIGENRKSGDERIDKLIKEAIDDIKKFKDENDHGGIGDTATDECIAYEVDRLMGSDTVMAGGILLNRE